MTSALYASLAAVLIVWLSLQVINVRRAKKISLGDGNDDELKTVMAAQENALNYVPITLLLLFALEYNNGYLIVVHVFGLLFMLGRVIHARAILASNLDKRVLGMQITFFVIIGLAIANLVALPYFRFYIF